LRDIAAAGFSAVEVCATATHIDYRNEASTADLQQWLAEAGLTLTSVHAPVADSFAAGRYGTALNLASADADERQHAMDDTLRALHMARRLAFRTFVVHAGVPTKQLPSITGVNSRDAVRRSIDLLVAQAEPLGVTVAVELIPNELSRSGSLVHLIEDVLESGAAGICLDLGHARLEGDVADVIDTVSEHVVVVHAHDNRGRTDDHLLPLEGSIDWPEAMTALQKMGFDGAVIFEPAPARAPREVLARARHARVRLEHLLADGWADQEQWSDLA
jgi:sugar phosphate isomerase/epimerase